ncbi:MAG: tannase/feruloyl esterase family alpha/beta hydrolase [Lautropia sp.]|nr:tannase/feruloyl esterase family alpha/beta hydrolase [Lautropia sp.]
MSPVTSLLPTTPARTRRLPLSTLPALLLIGSSLLPAMSHASQPLPPVQPRVACTVDSFNHVGLPEAPTRVTAASVENVNGKSMCMITGVISPQVRFIVRLPVKDWSQRYLQTGCGGLCGRLGIHSPQRDCQFEQDGTLAMASTNMGHEGGSGGIWGASDMQLRVDFGYRAVHVTALIAKELMQVYYGRKPAFSYFSGCSDGGREALMSAQRYPDDFDGIAAGAPSLLFLVQNSMYHGWNAHIVQPDSPEPTVLEHQLPILHRRALAECDHVDGQKDGIVSDPACVVDPLQWVCKPGETGDCISQRTATAVNALYRGAHHRHERLVVGSVLPGSELAWRRVIVPRNERLQQIAAQRAAGERRPRLPATVTPPNPQDNQDATSPANKPATSPDPSNTQGIVPTPPRHQPEGSAPAGTDQTARSNAAPSASAPSGPAGNTATQSAPSAPAAGGNTAAAPARAPAMDQVVLPPDAVTVGLTSSTSIIPTLAFADRYDPTWRLSNFRFTRETLERLKPMHALLDASNPDLSAFHARGGKLLIWHGLGDQHITPMNAIAYYQAVRDTLGEKAAHEMMRLFLVPGMYHCDGGPLASIDVMTPLIDWVESDEAPETLMASPTPADAQAGKGRNLYPFPYLSELKPGGNLSTPSDWQRGRPIVISDTRYKDWAGADFFLPGFQRDCGFEGFDFVCRDWKAQSRQPVRAAARNHNHQPGGEPARATTQNRPHDMSREGGNAATADLAANP